MIGQIKSKSAPHMLSIDKFQQSLGFPTEITPGDNRMIFIHGKQFVNYKGTTLNPCWGVGEALICIPKVQGNGRSIPVVRAQFSLGQYFLSWGSQVVK